MKLKNCITFFVLLSVTFAQAQVGIGTSSPNSSLDIRSSSQAAPSSTDGVLIPKIDVFPPNPTVNQQGMLVYLTTVAGANQPGFYYWNFPTLTWIGLGASTPGWSLTGNATTTPGTNFLGTTDDKDIVLKRNNIRAGYIGDPVFTGVATPIYNNGNTVLGANSLINPTLNVASQYGVRNTVMGTNSMTNSTRGRRNVSIGDASMTLNTDGSENTAVGVGALYSNLTGSGNVAIGRNTLTSATVGNNTGVGFAALRSDTTGTNNTAFGYQSGYTNSTGGNNVYLGNNAGYLNTGSGNVMIGNETGYNETGSNKLYINNAQADAVTALVYGEFDNKKFRVNGQLQISNQATTGYSFPTARGTNGQILQTDGNGTLSWVSSSSNLSVMRAQLYFPAPNATVGDQTLGNGGWQKILFNTIVSPTSYDPNAEFNTATNRYTATKAGYYQVNAAYHIRANAGTGYFGIGIRINSGSTNIYYAESGTPNTANEIIPRAVNSTVYLAVGDYVEIYAECYVNGAIIESFPGKTYFEVNQIR